MTWAAAAAAAAQAYGQYQMNKQSFNQSQGSSDRAFALNFWAQNYFMDKQNEYNKPINQMRRLEEAGLNPNLVYGSGADALSASPSGGGAQGVTFPQTKMSLDVIEKKHMLNSIRQQDANIARTEADTRAVNENINIAKAQLALRQAESRARVAQINADTRYKTDMGGLPPWARLLVKANQYLDGKSLDRGNRGELVIYPEFSSFGDY